MTTSKVLACLFYVLGCAESLLAFFFLHKSRRAEKTDDKKRQKNLGLISAVLFFMSILWLVFGFLAEGLSQ